MQGCGSLFWNSNEDNPNMETPNEDDVNNLAEAVARIEQLEVTKVTSIQRLRKQIQNLFLRNMISGLWFAILYRAVERTRLEKEPHQRAIQDLIVHLRDANEIANQHSSISKTMSKRMRSGLAAWYVLEQKPSLIVTENFSTSPTKKYKAILQQRNPSTFADRSSKFIRRVFLFLVKILKPKGGLFHYLEDAIADMDELLIKPSSPSSRPGLGGVLPHSACDLSLETAFHRNVFPQNIVQYDTPIFICVQSGDINGLRSLVERGLASVYDVDPYGLGLLYYAGYYCWRGFGGVVAMQMCIALLQMGADISVLDEIGHGPIDTITDSALVARREGIASVGLIDVAILCGKTTQELIDDHRLTCKFTSLHDVMLGLDPNSRSLSSYIDSVRQSGKLAQIIDQPDARGRTCLAWAVEYGMVETVHTLLISGANPNQYRRSSRSCLPLLHLVIAGPTQSTTSRLYEVVKILLTTDININARDEEGWTAWHVAASWRSYDILREILCSHGHVLDLQALTLDGASAFDLSQDPEFYTKTLELWAGC